MNKQELEKDNKGLREEIKRLIDTNQKLQSSHQELSQELYNTQIMELQKRRELDTAQALAAQYKEELSNLQSSLNSSESSLPSQESPPTP